MRQAYLIIIGLLASISVNGQQKINVDKVDLVDTSRSRTIPTLIYYGEEQDSEIIIVSSCYECANSKYSSLATRLAQSGFTVVVIQHEIAGDEPIATKGDIYKLRMPVWLQGVSNIKFVSDYVRSRYNGRNSKIILIGHSHGGDISALYSEKYSEGISSLILLDNRRVAPPKNNIPVLDLRGDQFVPDDGVVPSDKDRSNFKVVYFKKTNHIEFSDEGRSKIKKRMNCVILDFIKKNSK